MEHKNRGFSRRGTHPVGFFLNNRICFNFVSILFEKIKLTVSERTYIIVPMVQLGFMKFKQQWVRPYFVRSNMAAVSSVTWQILLQWRHVKTLYTSMENVLWGSQAHAIFSNVNLNIISLFDEHRREICINKLMYTSSKDSCHIIDQKCGHNFRICWQTWTCPGHRSACAVFLAWNHITHALVFSRG